MESIKSRVITVFLLLFISIAMTAQNDRYQLYLVHEDHVKPGMKDKHAAADMAILDAAKKYNMTGMNWLTFQGDDNRVMYLSPINSFADLDKNPFEDLKKKMGDEEYEKLFEPFSETYTEHGDYILRLDRELSYMPEGITQTPAGKNYRTLTFYYIPPGKGEKAEQLARSVKDLYTKKNSPIHYRVYKSGFGNMGNYYMVAVAAEGPEEMQKMQQLNQELIGEDGKKIFDEIDQTASKIETLTGYVKPELSYLTNN